MKIDKVLNKNPSGKGQNGTVYSDKGIAPALASGGKNPNRNRDIGWVSGYVLVSPKLTSTPPYERPASTEASGVSGESSCYKDAGDSVSGQDKGRSDGEIRAERESSVPLVRGDRPASSMPRPHQRRWETDEGENRQSFLPLPPQDGMAERITNAMCEPQSHQGSGEAEGTPKVLRVFSTFSGVGGFEIGIGRAGITHEIVGFSEIDKHACAVLRYHYPNVKNYGSITDINWQEVPDFDLLVGGSPCQDLSIAGKRAGFDGVRSGLFFEYLRAVKEKRPDRFIWENVRGALSSSKGWDFAAVLVELAQAGYSLQWQVLNAKHFGVPQNRERVFVIGTRADLGSPREIFFEQGAGGQDILRTQYGPHQQDSFQHPDGIASTIAPGTHGSGPHLTNTIINLEPGANQANRRYDPKGIAPTVPTTGGGRHIPMIDLASLTTTTTD